MTLGFEERPRPPHPFKRLSTRTRQFEQFRTRLPWVEWRGRTVLDFGGNRGGFLRGAGGVDGVVQERDYWCIDTCREALAEGKRRFPDAHFVHFDRFSPGYNPSGRIGEPLPRLDVSYDVSFDVIVAFSVFTHVHTADMLTLVRQLQEWLRPDGTLAFTFSDPCYDPRHDPDYDLALLGEAAEDGDNLVERMLKLRTVLPELPMAAWMERTRGARWCSLTSDEALFEPSEEESLRAQRGEAGPDYITYYRASYMQELFPDAQILPPLSPERQHFCVLRGRADSAGSAQAE